jgi:hypothetical protein
VLRWTKAPSRHSGGPQDRRDLAGAQVCRIEIEAAPIRYVVEMLGADTDNESRAYARQTFEEYRGLGGHRSRGSEDRRVECPDTERH